MKRLPYSDLPGWPRRMSVALAASYLGISPAKLLDGAGTTYPAAIRDGRRMLWDRAALDAYVDGQEPAGAASGRDPIMDKINERRQAQARQRGAA